jgi:SOS-response transcriptional repressor LexA
VTEKGERRRWVILLYLLHCSGPIYPPTLEDIAAKVGLAAKSAARAHLLVLRERGLVAWDRRCARTVRLTQAGFDEAERLLREAS